jgi:hypothetical protein
VFAAGKLGFEITKRSETTSLTNDQPELRATHSYQVLERYQLNAVGYEEYHNPKGQNLFGLDKMSAGYEETFGTAGKSDNAPRGSVASENLEQVFYLVTKVEIALII